MSISIGNAVGRREFLVTSAATLVATAAVGNSIFAAGSAAPVRSLAVGFAHAAEKPRLFSASALTAGDGGFIGAGARISISGSSGTPGVASQRRVVQLLTNFPYFDGATLKMAPFQAWGANRATGEQGNPIRFTVPVDLLQNISFDVVVESGVRPLSAPVSRRRALRSPGESGGGGATSLPVKLSVKSDPSAIALVRGFYVIAPLFEGDSTPHWTRYRLFQVDGRFALIDDAGGLAPFEHIVLSTSYASQ